jgi:phosphoglycolate phosphatase-like HAD superfamily hydrolase
MGISAATTLDNNSLASSPWLPAASKPMAPWVRLAENDNAQALHWLKGQSAANDSNMRALHKSVLSPDNETIVLDSDETIFACDKLTKRMKTRAKKLGYQIKKSLEGREYILRPGALELLSYTGTLELLRYMKERGHKIILCTRNLRNYMEDLVKSSGIGEYVDAVVTREDLLSAPENEDFKKYPHHAARIGAWERFTSGLYRNTIGTVEHGMRFIKAKLTGRVNPRPDEGPKLNKYPQAISAIATRLTGKYFPEAHILIDNKYLENQERAQQSGKPGDKGAWTTINPGQFNGDKPEKRLPSGEYEWVAKIKQGLEMGWEKHLETHQNPKEEVLAA